MIDIKKIRGDFPVLRKKIHGKKLVYLDNAATSLKPRQVVKALEEYYLEYTANIHRAVHYLSEKATEEYENARRKVKEFIGAKSTKEIIFTKGATASINLVAQSFGKAFLNEDDEILISHMEHHSNIVPWQLLCHEKRCKLKVIPILDDGTLDYQAFQGMLTRRTKLVSLVHVSNSLGTVNPVKKVIRKAHEHNIPVLLDGAQAVGKIPVDLGDLDCEFYVFSAHKMFGPTGVGVLYGKEKFLEVMPPAEGGGDMISSVTFEKTTYNKLPYKFEAGTPPIAGVIALGAAIDYIRSIGIEHIRAYEKTLLDYAQDKCRNVSGLKIIGQAPEKTAIVSFVVNNIHPHDIGTLLDQEGIAIRTGHHCTQPVMERFSIPAASRISMSVYNTQGEIDQTFRAIEKVKKVFG